MKEKGTTITSILPRDLFNEYDKRVKKEARHKAHIMKLFVEYYVRYGLDDIIKALEEDEVESRR